MAQNEFHKMIWSFPFQGEIGVPFFTSLSKELRLVARNFHNGKDNGVENIPQRMSRPVIDCQMPPHLSGITSS